MPTDYNQIVNIKWENASALISIKEIITQLGEAEKSLDRLRAASAALAVNGGAGTSAAQAAPAWYTQSPNWYRDGSAPNWYTTPPTWYTTSAPSAPPVIAASGVAPSTPNATIPQPAMVQSPVTAQGQMGGGVIMPNGQVLMPQSGPGMMSMPAQQAQVILNPSAGPGMFSNLPPMFSTPAGQATSSMLSLANLPQSQVNMPNMRYDLSGLTGGALAMGLRYNKGIAQDEQGEAFGQAGLAGIAGNASARSQAIGDVQRLQSEIDGYNKSLKDVTNTSNEWNNQLMRHAGWMVQGLAMAAVFGTIAAAIKSAVDQSIQLDDATARLSSMGVTGNVSNQVVMGDIQAAQYGIGTAEANKGMMSSQRYSLSQQEVTSGQQLSVVYGAQQYDAALKGLYQTKQAMNAANLQEYNYMDSLATIYRRVTPDMSAAMTAVQEATRLYRELGTTPENAAIGIARTAEAMQESPKAAATQMEGIVRTLESKKTQEYLKQFGIDTSGGTGETIRQIIPELNKLRDASGKGSDAADKAYTDFVTAISSVGVNSRSMALSVNQVFSDLNKMYIDADKPLNSWNDMYSKAMDSAIIKTEQLKASWDAFVTSIMSSPGAQGVMGAAKAGMDATSSGLNRDAIYSQIPDDVKQQYAQQFYDSQGGYVKALSESMAAGYKATSGVQGLLSGGAHIPGALDLAAGITILKGQTEQYAINQWMARNNTSQYNDTGAGMPTGYTAPTSAGGAVPFAFTSMTAVPGGSAYYHQLMDAYGRRQSQLAQVPGFTDKSSDQALSDFQGMPIPGSAKSYDTTALKLATDDVKRNSEYSIIQNMPNVTSKTIQDQVNIANKQLMQLPDYAKQYDQNVKTYEYYNTTTRTWDQIKATQEEMNEATKEIQKNTSQIKGVFNVPSGGRVPWAAIEAGYVDTSRAPSNPSSGLPSNFQNTPLGSFMSMFSNFAPGVGNTNMMSIPGSLQSAAPRYSSGAWRTPQTADYISEAQRNRPVWSDAGTAMGNSNIVVNSPVSVTVPVNVSIDGQLLSSHVQSSMASDVARTGRASSSGRRSYMM